MFCCPEAQIKVLRSSVLVLGVLHHLTVSSHGLFLLCSKVKSQLSGVPQKDASLPWGLYPLKPPIAEHLPRASLSHHVEGQGLDIGTRGSVHSSAHSSTSLCTVVCLQALSHWEVSWTDVHGFFFCVSFFHRAWLHHLLYGDSTPCPQETLTIQIFLTKGSLSSVWWELQWLVWFEPRVSCSS